MSNSTKLWIAAGAVSGTVVAAALLVVTPANAASLRDQAIARAMQARQSHPGEFVIRIGGGGEFTESSDNKTPPPRERQPRPPRDGSGTE